MSRKTTCNTFLLTITYHQDDLSEKLVRQLSLLLYIVTAVYSPCEIIFHLQICLLSQLPALFVFRIF